MLMWPTTSRSNRSVEVPFARGGAPDLGIGGRGACRDLKVPGPERLGLICPFPSPAVMPPASRGITVVGALLDADGVRYGWARLDGQGRVVEEGPRATAPRTEKSRQVFRGIVLPRPVNGHTHLGDALWTREPPHVGVALMVGPPRGLKHRVLREASAPAKEDGMRGALTEMARLGTAVTIDFREEGASGVNSLRRAARGTGVEPVILGRPTEGRATPEELRRVLSVADGLGLSALADVSPAWARAMASETRRRGKLFALHASERVREPIDAVLDLHPNLIVHLCAASPSDLERVRDAGPTVAACSRSNALFGRAPPLAQMEHLGIPFLLGTDNAMLQAPDIFREMEFSYLTSRARGSPVRPETLVKAVFVNPWRWLGRPEETRLIAGGPARAIALHRPVEDPYYQVCARSAGRHLLYPPASRGDATDGGTP